jgi:hypothetical protein
MRTVRIQIGTKVLRLTYEGSVKRKGKTNNKAEAKAPYSNHVTAVRRATW